MSGPKPASFQDEAEALVKQMTVREKASLCSGSSFWYLQPVQRLGMQPVMVSDGPHGVRKDLGSSHLGLAGSAPATCFPTASCLGASWDRELLVAVGEALGRESCAHGVSVLLGPGVNIKRHPLCGRNFEYFSEDPLLAGELGAAWISGVQSTGIGASLKHFAANNQEKRRMIVDTRVDERTLREIYLVPFELAVHKGKPWTVMCAYNRLNGYYCSEHQWLLTTLLRDEWGYEGLVVTDWGAINDRCLGLLSGLDIEMPSSAGYNDRKVESAIKQAKLSEKALNTSVQRTTALILASLHTKRATAEAEAVADAAEMEAEGNSPELAGGLPGHRRQSSFSKLASSVTGAVGCGTPPRPNVPLYSADGTSSPDRPTPAPARRVTKREAEAAAQAQERRAAARLQALLERNHAIAKRAAVESAVLLKNRAVVGAGGAPRGAPLLPLVRGSSVALIGGFAEIPRFQGAGSSKVNAHRIEVPLSVLRDALGPMGCEVSYAQGFEPDYAELSEESVAEAIELAASSELAIVLAGLPDSYESEGFDRDNMRLPPQVDALIAAVARAQPRVVVVLFNGAPVEMPWLECVPALLEMYLPGQAGALALAELLTGKACPSGKLAETFPLSPETCASDAHFGNNPHQLVYREALNVGYRYFATHGVATLFPFGHGLSYTRFEYGKLELAGSAKMSSTDSVEFSVDVTNVGGVEGAEVVQIYVRDLEASVYRPKLELRDFGKLRLKPRETGRLSFTLAPRAFAFWDTLAGGFYVEPGLFEILVGASSADIRLTTQIEVVGPRRARVGGQALGSNYTTLNDAELETLGLYVPIPDQPLPFHINTAVGDVATHAGCLGRLFWRLLEAGMGEVPDRTEQMLRVEMVRSLPLQALMRFANGSAGRILWPEKLLHLMVWLFNVAARCCGGRDKRPQKRFEKGPARKVKQAALRAPLTEHVTESPLSSAESLAGDTTLPVVS